MRRGLRLFEVETLLDVDSFIVQMKRRGFRRLGKAGVLESEEMKKDGKDEGWGSWRES